MKPEGNDTGNVVEFQARNSAKRDLQASSGEDEPETRQDLVVVLLTYAQCQRINTLCLRHGTEDDGDPLIMRSLNFAKWQTNRNVSLEESLAVQRDAQPPPDQGEHVAQRKEGESFVCAHCGRGEWISYPGSNTRYCRNPHCPTAVETSA